MIEIRKKYEELLAFHCAPTLKGYKAANMVSFPTENNASYIALQNYLEDYKTCFQCKGICAVELCRQEKHVLMLFYRPADLARLLHRYVAREILKQYNYPVDSSLEDLLLYLRLRIKECNGFPHEVGIFLGYPPRDVLAFIEHKGQDYICCGYWKVYTNEVAARRAFASYNKCTEMMCRELRQGKSIKSMIA